MRGPDPKYPIRLTTEEVERLQRLIRAHTSSQAVVVRAQIVVTAHEHPEWSNQQIARALATSDRMVRKWRGRWTQTQSLADAPR